MGHKTLSAMVPPLVNILKDKASSVALAEKSLVVCVWLGRRFGLVCILDGVVDVVRSNTAAFAVALPMCKMRATPTTTTTPFHVGQAADFCFRKHSGYW